MADPTKARAAKAAKRETALAVPEPKRDKRKVVGAAVLFALLVLALFFAAGGTSGQPPAACDFDTDCPDGWQCLNGVCVNVTECDVDADCPVGFMCTDGICVEVDVDDQPPPAPLPVDNGPDFANSPCKFYFVLPPEGDPITVIEYLMLRVTTLVPPPDNPTEYAIQTMVHPYNARFWIDNNWMLSQGEVAYDSLGLVFSTYNAQVNDPQTGSRDDGGLPPYLFFPCYTVGNGGIPDGEIPPDLQPECDPGEVVTQDELELVLGYLDPYIEKGAKQQLFSGRPPVMVQDYGPVPANQSGQRSYYRTAASRVLQGPPFADPVRWVPGDGQCKWPGDVGEVCNCVVTRPTQDALWTSVENLVDWWWGIANA